MARLCKSNCLLHPSALDPIIGTLDSGLLMEFSAAALKEVFCKDRKSAGSAKGHVKLL